MVSALDSKSSSPGLSAGLGHCVVFLGKRVSRGSSNIPSQLHATENSVGQFGPSVGFILLVSIFFVYTVGLNLAIQ